MRVRCIVEPPPSSRVRRPPWAEMAGAKPPCGPPRLQSPRRGGPQGRLSARASTYYHV